MVQHFFTVDVEEYFQVSGLEPWIPRQHWSSLESRVDRSMGELLELLDRHRTKGTFFILGWLAQRKPGLVRTIAAEGHEIASHGWEHRKVFDLTPDRFRGSVRRTKQLLEDVSGLPVRGYRAPSFSILQGMEWALDILIEEGYRYDSSLYPIRRPGYGFAGGARDPHWLFRPGGTLLELPPATLKFSGVSLPAGGGGYFRVFPFPLIRHAMNQAQRRGVSATFYIHPWELDPKQPRFPVSWMAQVRQYGGLTRTSSRLERLLREFRFQPVESFLPVVTPLTLQRKARLRRRPHVAVRSAPLQS